jgi:hypothetical protein
MFAWTVIGWVALLIWASIPRDRPAA